MISAMICINRKQSGEMGTASRSNSLTSVCSRASGFSAGCGCCPLRAACLYRGQPRVWMLTSEGDRLLAKSDVSPETSEL
jgi:hypothetical protein